MIVYDKEKKEILVPQKIICDICMEEAYQDEPEYDEFFSIRFYAGYGSAFEDGESYECDICSSCLKKKLGKYIKKSED